MGSCNIDHTVEDVIKKVESQSAYLPEDITSQLMLFLKRKQEQETLNNIFHLVKKYDLSSAEEQEERNKKLRAYFAK